MPTEPANESLDSLMAAAAQELSFASEAEAATVFRTLSAHARSQLASPEARHRRAGAVRAAREGMSISVLATVLRKAGETGKDAMALAQWAADRAAETPADL